MSRLSPLPVDGLLESIAHTLRSQPIVLIQAPPGSGKTTRVAPFLLNDPVAQEKRIYLLQPRRIAAKTVCQRIAWERGWSVGEQVGYQVRFENRTRRSTRLIVATEGILLRRLQDDPILDDTAVVILDEFHERSLSADLSLGMLRRVQQTMRPDLRLVLMSATLDADHLRASLGDIPCLLASGTVFDVDIRHHPPVVRGELTDHIVRTVVQQIRHDSGSMLVFLPGVGEIQKVQRRLASPLHAAGWDLMTLHGSQPLEEQSKAIERGPRPRVVLATNVAESSLTVEDIHVVVDSGLVRVLRYDPRMGLDRLELEPVCQASAIQRSGRAGRTALGVCIRLWDEASQRSRPAQLEPEVRRVDLSFAVIQLLAWGEADLLDFPWPEVPRPEAVEAAKLLLVRLGAWDGHHITPLGRTLAMLPIAPRLGRLLVEAHAWSVLHKASLLAALLSERSPFKPSDVPSARGSVPSQGIRSWASDTLERNNALCLYFDSGVVDTPLGTLHRPSAQRILEAAKQLERTVVDQLGAENTRNVSEGEPPMSEDERLMRCLLTAFPDRLARRREVGKSTGIMVGGKGVCLDRSSGVASAELFVCVEVQDQPHEALVRQASAVEEAWLDPTHITEREELYFHPIQRQVVARKRRYWMDLLLRETPVAVTQADQAQHLLFEAARADLSQVLPDEFGSLDLFRQRVACLNGWIPEWNLPPVDASMLEQVLLQLCHQARSFHDLRKAPWDDWIRGRFSTEQLRLIDREAPERIQTPKGHWLKIEYQAGKPPVLAVKIQDIFAWKETPRIALGRVPLLLHLLAPNMRPQQVTDDLPSFWRTTYHVVRKELKRRYPKHPWPEDPQGVG